MGHTRYNRVWTVTQKLEILREVAAARATKERGAIAAVLRKYSINTAFVRVWSLELLRKARKQNGPV